MSKDIQTTVEEFLKVLKKSADEKYRKGSVVSTPSSLRKLGVSVPIKRKIAREWLEENREMIEVDFLTLLNTLLQQPISEMRGLALELLWSNKKVLKDFDWQVAEKWLSDIDNWGHCDFLSCNIFGFLVKQDQTHLKKLKSYLKKPGKWFQRAGIISTLQLIRAKEIDSEEVLAMINQIIDNQDPMIQKAISWVLRELVRAGYSREVEEYITKNQTRLAKYVTREVNNKLRTGLKSGKERRIATD